MIFTRRHEQELAEIKALNQELGQSSAEALQRARRIRERGRPTGHAGDNNGGEPLVAFVHIPKTAGMTVTSVFARAYSRAELHDAGNIFRGGQKTVGKIARPRVRNARVTIGHVPFAVFREHLPSDTRYVTFLREPVDRVLSHYYGHIHWRSSRTEERRPVTADSLEQAIVEQRLPHVTNLATRLLCSDPSPLGELRASALGEAKANLRDFTFVGMTERSDESIALLQRALGLGLIPYGEHRNVSSKRPAVEEITDEQRALIADYNRLDAELYTFAQGLFEEAVAAAGDQLAADVEELSELNASAVQDDQAELQRAYDWLDRELPAGTSKPANAMKAAAANAGIHERVVKRAVKRLGVSRRGRDHDGRRVWQRTAPDGDGDLPRKPYSRA